MPSFFSLRPLLLKCGLLLFLCLLLMFPETSLSGAKSGLLLWFNQVLPSLLPFLILSSLFLSTGLSERLTQKLSPLLSPVLHCSPSGCYAVVIGLFAGLPVGAKTIASLLEQKKITKKEGTFLLPLCNNMSPLFILGYISISVLKLPSLRYVLLIILLFSSFLAAILTKPKELRGRNAISVPAGQRTPSDCEKFSFSFFLLDSAIEQAFSVLTRVGGYMVLFSVLATLLTKLPLPPLVLACVGSVLETTTGSAALAALSLPRSVLIPFVGAAVSFGGLSTAAQTKSVLAGTGLPLTHYLATKALAALITALFLFLTLYII